MRQRIVKFLRSVRRRGGTGTGRRLARRTLWAVMACITAFALLPAPVRAAAPAIPTMEMETIRGYDNYYLYANGTELLLEDGIEGTDGYFSVTYTKVFYRPMDDPTGDFIPLEIAVEGKNIAGNLRDGYKITTWDIYGGSKGTTVDSGTKITVAGGDVADVYGGGRGSSSVVTGGADITVRGGDVYHLYGGGQNGAAVNGDIRITMTGGEVYDLYGGGESGGSEIETCSVKGGTTVTVTGGKVSGSISGGGRGGSVAGAAVVTVSGDAKVSGDIYGGGIAFLYVGSQTYEQNASVGSTDVTISGSAVTGSFSGSVYGGGNGSSSVVEGARSVTIGGKPRIGDSRYRGVVINSPGAEGKETSGVDSFQIGDLEKGAEINVKLPEDIAVGAVIATDAVESDAQYIRLVGDGASGKEAQYFDESGGVIKLKPHSHSWSTDWSGDGDAHWHECQNGGCPITEDSQKDGYAVHVPNEDDGDCTTAVTCSVCGGVVTAAKRSHSFGDWESAGAEGHKRACTRSGCSVEETAAHTPNEDDGDCTTAVTCSACSYAVTAAQSSHSYTTRPSDVLVSEATCTAAAVYRVRCDRCDAVSDSLTVPVGATISHSYTRQTAGDDYKAADADCTNAAIYYYSCAACGASEGNSSHTFSSGDPLGHSYSYTIDGGTITEKCVRTGCGETHTAQITAANDGAAVSGISAPYNGKEFTFSVTPGAGWAGNQNMSVSFGRTVKDKAIYSTAVTCAAGKTVEYTFTVTQAENRITGLSLKGWTYGGAANVPSAAAIFGAPDFTYSREQNGTYGTAVPTGAGIWWVKASVAATADYAGAEASESFVIEPKEVGLRWTAPEDLVYSGTAKVPTVAAIGLVGDDTCAVTAGLTEGADNVNAGSFTYTASQLNNGNYKLPAAAVSDSYTIRKGTLTKDDFVFTQPAGRLYTGRGITASAVVRSGDKYGTVGAPQLKYKWKDGDGGYLDSMTATGVYDVFVCVDGGGNWNSIAADPLDLEQDVTIVPVTVYFHKNADDAAGVMDAQEISTTQTGLTANAFTREGYHFSGWSTNTSGGGTVYADQAIYTPTGEDVTLYAQWTEVSRHSVVGAVKDSDGRPRANVRVELRKGDTVYYTLTDAAGGFLFTDVVRGAYNLVVIEGTQGSEKTVTRLMDVDRNLEGVEVVIPSEKINSILKVADPGEAVSGSSAIKIGELVVGGLDAEAAAVKQENSSASSITVSMFVEQKTAADAAAGEDASQEEKETAENLKAAMEAIRAAKGAAGKTMEYLEIRVTKEVDQVSSPVDATSEVLEIVLPFHYGNRQNIAVYRFHGGGADVLDPLDTKPAGGYEDGRYYLDRENGLIYIYAGNFSLYSVGYTVPSRSSGGGGGYSGYSVVLPTGLDHGSVSADRKTASAGTEVTLTVVPEQGYVLSGLTVTDGRGNAIQLISGGDGSFTFKMPGDKVYVKADFVPETCGGGEDCPSEPFTDVNTGLWYHQAVDYVLRNRMMSGYDSGLFGPEDDLSRGMLAQILYNAEGRPNTAGENRFTDVKEGSWYTDAVTWAAAGGIAAGYPDGTFGPEDPITREQLAVILWQYDGSPEISRTLGHFKDHDQISSYAQKALQWANEKEIVNGRGGGILEPGGTATRAEASAMLMHYMEGRK